MWRTRKALGKLVITRDSDSVLRVPDDMGNYFGLIAFGSRRAVDKALDGFVDRDDLEPDFYSEFRRRIQSALKRKGDKMGLIEFGDIDSFAEKLSMMIEASVTRACKQLPIAGPVPSIDVQAGEGQRSEKTERSIVKFPLQDNLRWNEVTMEFVSDDSIKITARGTRKTVTFEGLGFQGRTDRRPAGPPLGNIPKTSRTQWQDQLERLESDNAQKDIESN